MDVSRIVRMSLRLSFAVVVIAAAAAFVPSQWSAPSAAAANGIPGSTASCDSLIDFLFLQVPEPGWVWVDPANKYQSTSGVVRESFVTETDFPTVHDSHDQNTHILADASSAGLISDANDPGEIELEWETGTFPSEDTSDPERFFPKWVYPSVGDRIWANGNWIFDCGHPKDVGGEDHFNTEIHPPRAFASMRDQVGLMPGSGTTPVHTVSTDLYIHGLSGFVVEDLICGQDVILDIFGGCAQDPHRGTPIDADYDFDICTPAKPSSSAVLKWTQEDGPGNDIGTAAVLSEVPATGACAAAGFGPVQVHVHVPLAGTGVTPDRVYARRITAGWIYPPNGLKHINVKLTKIDLHQDTEPAGFDCECSFWWMNVNRSPNEWFRLVGFDIPTLEDFDLLDPCFDQTNRLTDFDDDLGCGNGELNFSGPTFDFYVADGQSFTVWSNAYDQDCFDGLFGNHNLVVTGPLLGACYLDLPDEGDNDKLSDLSATFGPPGYGAGDQNIAAGDYNMLFTVTSEAVTTEDTADLSLIKACKPDLTPALAGQTVNCTIVVSNPGPGLPRNVVVHDTLLTSVAPADYSMSVPTFTFSGGGSSTPCVLTAITGGKQFRCDLGTVPVDGSVLITYQVVSNEAGDFDNFAEVTTDSTDPNGNNNRDRSDVKVIAVANLSLGKTDSPDPLVAGTDITYTLQARNAGPSTAPNVVIRDFLPDSVTVVSVNGGAGGSCVPGVPGDPSHPTRCTYASLASSATATMQIVVRVKPGDHRVINNEATVSSDVLDPDSSNNSASASTAVRIADLKLVKTSDADVYKPSSQITYTLAVTNNGPGNAENVVVSDALPTATDRVVVLDSSCTLAGTTVTCNLGTLAPLASRTLTIAIIAKGKSGQISNTASVSSSTFDPDTSNNSSTRVVLSGNPPKP
jgi:uncharacterized repeat protein (TIGR01451 family)